MASKVVDYCNVGVTVSGLAETIDQDANLKGELKDALKDFIEENDISWLKEQCSPTTKILLIHLLPIMTVARRSEKLQKAPEIVPQMKRELATATLRNVFHRKVPCEPEITARPHRDATSPTRVKLV